MENLLAERLIRDVPDFPRKGIVFKDITPVVQDYSALKQVVEKMTEWGSGRNVEAVVGIEARGFIFGAPLALALGVGFVPLRKLGKLPHKRVSEEYSLEYGTNTVEIHADSLQRGQRVVIVDDLLATGGTAAAAGRLVERVGGVIAGYCFMIELDFLEGRAALAKHEVLSLIHYS